MCARIRMMIPILKLTSMTADMKSWRSIIEYSMNRGSPIYEHLEARFTNKIPGCEFRGVNSGGTCPSEILEVYPFHHFTKLSPKSFVTVPFIGFGISPWLLGTDSGGIPTPPKFFTETPS